MGKTAPRSTLISLPPQNLDDSVSKVEDLQDSVSQASQTVLTSSADLVLAQNEALAATREMALTSQNAMENVIRDQAILADAIVQVANGVVGSF